MWVSRLALGFNATGSRSSLVNLDIATSHPVDKAALGAIQRTLSTLELKVSPCCARKQERRRRGRALGFHSTTLNMEHPTTGASKNTGVPAPTIQLPHEEPLLRLTLEHARTKN